MKHALWTIVTCAVPTRSVEHGRVAHLIVLVEDLSLGVDTGRISRGHVHHLVLLAEKDSFSVAMTCLSFSF